MGDLPALVWGRSIRGRHRCLIDRQVRCKEGGQIDIFGVVGVGTKRRRPLPFHIVEYLQIATTKNLRHQPLPFKRRAASVAISPIFR